MAYPQAQLRIANLLQAAGPVQYLNIRLRRPDLSLLAETAVLLIAAILAIIILQGRIVSILMFLPGLILGWRFIRTKSLLAPVLFHVPANTCYLGMAAAFA